MIVRAFVRACAVARSAGPEPVAGYLGLTVLSALAPLAAAWLTKVMVDLLAAGQVRWSQLAGVTVLLALAGIAGALVPHAGRYLRSEIERRVSLDATAQLYAAVDRFVGVRRFEDPAFLDHLQIARSSGVTAPAQVVDGALGAVRALLTVFGFAATLFVLGPWIAGTVVLSAVPAVVAEVALSRRRAAAVARTGQAQRRELFYAGLLTDPQAAKEIRLFGAGPYLWSRMAAEIRGINSVHRRIDRREVVVQGALALLGAAVAGGLLVWTVRSAVSGALTVGDVALVIAAVGAVQAALAGLVTEAVSVHQAALLFTHYLTVLEAGPDLPVPAEPRPVPPLRVGIELRDVWFRYAEDQPWVLRGIDLVLPAGLCTAVVGLNGAGKTTLVKLICRLYDPQRGAVLWDGVDVRDFEPAELRHRVRAVFQDATSYDLTARENIAIGDLTALHDQGRVETAAGAAGVHDVLAALPQGYETLLTRIFFSVAEQSDPEAGVTLSGGQWQRLAVARGLVREQPDVLVLDEPSSAMDPQAEQAVHTRLREHRRGLTTMLISHRLGVVRAADQIVVLSGGRVVERGTHRELVAAGGDYAALFALQAAGYHPGAPEEVPA